MDEGTMEHGGARRGAGRPKGSRMRRSDALADKLIAAGKCPVDALVRLAEAAEAGGDLGQAINAWKSVAPYVYPKPKAIETAPELLVELAKDLAAARADATRSLPDFNFAEHVDRLAKEFDAAAQREASPDAATGPRRLRHD